MTPPRYSIVLVNPEIAENTGNIGRTCMALGCQLHLVHPLGFQITGARIKRAGLDYWPHLDLVQHDSVAAWLKACPPAGPVWLLSTSATTKWNPAEVPPGSTLVFGSESSGLPPEVLSHWPQSARKIPMDPRARSLNLAATVAMTLGSLIF